LINEVTVMSWLFS